MESGGQSTLRSENSTCKGPGAGKKLHPRDQRKARAADGHLHSKGMQVPCVKGEKQTKNSRAGRRQVALAELGVLDLKRGFPKSKGQAGGHTV